VGGVQPKVLIRDGEDAARGLSPPGTERASSTFRGATHLVKLWDPREHPELAANEYFCLRAAERCGLEVPRFRLSDDGRALVLDRFDLRPDGTYRGVEDLCVLNGRGSADRYRGSYETSVAGRLRQFINDATWWGEAERLFRLLVLSCAVRNGDAHLKNFAVVYDDVVRGIPRLAPVYDIVTTTAYVPVDKLALTFDGSTAWPSRKKLASFGSTRLGVTPSRVSEILGTTAEALVDTVPEVRRYAAGHPPFAPIAERMVAAWEEGIATSLRGPPP